MEAIDFNDLPLATREQLLKRAGKKLYEFETARKICMIYSIFSFFVEISFSRKDLSLRNVKALKSYHDWKGYLKSWELNMKVL